MSLVLILCFIKAASITDFVKHHKSFLQKTTTLVFAQSHVSKRNSFFNEITGGAWSWTGLQAFHHFQLCCTFLGNQPLFPAGPRWRSVSWFFSLFQIRRVVGLQATGRCFYSAEQQAQMMEQTRQAALSRSAAAPAKSLGLMAEIQFGQSKGGTPWPGMVCWGIRRRLEMTGNIFILAQQVK